MSKEVLFDKVIGKERFGLMVGDEKKPLVFLKTGSMGSIYGYKNKYLNFAIEVNRNFKNTVIISGDPKGLDCNLEKEFQFIMDKIGKYESVIFIGISNGGICAMKGAFRFPQISNVLTVNTPLGFDDEQPARKGIMAFSGTITAAYGDKDEFYDSIDSVLGGLDNLNVEIYKGCNHNFGGHDDEFFDLLVSFVEKANAKK